MAIQATSPLEYNYGTYSNPYFRLVLHLPLNGTDTPVDCFMYPSKQAYIDGALYIACLPFYVANIPSQPNNDGNGVVNKYLLYITEQVMNILQASNPTTTFEIIEIPREGDEPEFEPTPEPTSTSEPPPAPNPEPNLEE
jgi:hypothetical protein